MMSSRICLKLLRSSLSSCSMWKNDLFSLGIKHCVTVTNLTFARNLHLNVPFGRSIIHKNIAQLLKSNLHTETNEQLLENNIACLQCSDSTVENIMKKDMIIINDFITQEEEQSIIDEVEPYLKRMRYETSHWDDAIHGYRETERRQWREINKPIIQRIRDTAFPKHVSQLSFVHILDLSKEGFIKPHVDAVRFCGNTIAGLSLLSSSVMRLVHMEDTSKHADILLKQRSLYIMRNFLIQDHETVHSYCPCLKEEVKWVDGQGHNWMLFKLNFHAATEEPVEP